jgi:carbonic anhydrase/acetyltransferase-like protein (isoleucine patch superfamily)
MNKPTQIGNNVVVEAGAILHGCTLQDNTLVGAGSQVMDGAVLQKNSIVAPGSVVSPGKVILSGQLWQGVPAVFVRKLSDAEVNAIATKAAENAELAAVHATESAKSWQTIEEDEYNYEQERHRNPEYFQRLTPDVSTIIIIIIILYIILYL